MTKTTENIKNEEALFLVKSKKNPEHFRFFYDKYYEQIFRFIYLRMNWKEDAIDLTQQTFIKALKNIHQFEFKGFPFGTWLTRIAINEVNQFYRKSTKNRVINITTEIENSLFIEIESDEKVLNKEFLLESLKQLNIQEFSLIEMRFFENKPFKVIALELNITENNAKVKTYRVLTKLRQFFHSKKNNS